MKTKLHQNGKKWTVWPADQDAGDDDIWHDAADPGSAMARAAWSDWFDGSRWCQSCAGTGISPTWDGTARLDPCLTCNGTGAPAPENRTEPNNRAFSRLARRPEEFGSYERRLCSSDTREGKFRWKSYRRFGNLLQAIHEAAHAVADVRMGFGCAKVTLDPDGTYEGCAEAKESHPERFPEKNILSLLVGCAAEMHLGIPDESARWDARYDFDRARPLLAACAESEADGLAKAIAFATANWKAIWLVSQALIARRTLTGDEVERLLEVADGTRDDAALAPLSPPRLAVHPGITLDELAVHPGITLDELDQIRWAKNSER
ncbi:MAG TPA: hypothetical protein VK540_13945 [Polyangiaceae bacterium]|nr:hypothetical protein [Polyangiaceae bacterium]